MIEKQTNFWVEYVEQNYNAIVVTTNCIVKSDGCLVMGAGIALDFNKRFPYLSHDLGKRTKSHIELGRRGSISVINATDTVANIVSLPTKIDWRESSILSMIKENCYHMQIIANAFNWRKILMTRPGCGLGNLDWKVVKEAIDFLDDRFVVVYN